MFPTIDVNKEDPQATYTILEENALSVSTKGADAAVRASLSFSQRSSTKPDPNDSI